MNALGIRFEKKHNNVTFYFPSGAYGFRGFSNPILSVVSSTGLRSSILFILNVVVYSLRTEINFKNNEETI